MKYLLPLYLILMNAAGLIIMFADKQFARKKKWRIPEATLLAVSLLGGSIGSLLGMYLFRHKTKHAKFYIGLPVILAIQIILVYLLVLKLM